MGAVTVRQRIDQLATEPLLDDAPYGTDQKFVASALLGLQLLAEEVDALKSQVAALAARSQEAAAHAGAVLDTADLDDITELLADLVTGVKKLTKAVNATLGEKKKKKKKKKAKE